MSKLYVSRRRFILTASAAASTSLALHSCSASETQFPSSRTSNLSAGAGDRSNPVIALGFLPVVDCAPLVVAQARGLFAKHGLTNVILTRQSSWSVLRDNVQLGASRGGIDGGHFQSPVPELISEGIATKGDEKVPMYNLARMNTHAIGITVSNKFRDLGLTNDSSSLRTVVDRLKTENNLIRCAITFPRSSIDLWLHYWLGAGGIDPTTEADIFVIPPSQVTSSMKVDAMDIFCATDPWNARIVSEGVGFTATTVGEIWKNHPEKMFAMRADWVDAYPTATVRLIQAVMEAQQWCDQEEHRAELAQILARREFTGGRVSFIQDRLLGKINYGDGRTLDDPSLAIKFWSNDNVPISYPFKSLDTWFLIENMRWGRISADTDVRRIVDAVNREDLWKEAARAIDIPASQIPATTSRGKETFFDGVTFDPQNPQAYFKEVKLSKV